MRDVINKNTGTWDKELLDQLLTVDEVNAILTIPVSMFRREDALVWHYSKNGVYSVRSGYHLVVHSQKSSQQHKPSSSFHSKQKGVVSHLET